MATPIDISQLTKAYPSADGVGTPLNQKMTTLDLWNNFMFLVNKLNELRNSDETAFNTAISNLNSTLTGSLGTHTGATTGVHGATDAATANKLIIRDANGRAKIANPSDTTDITNKGSVDSAIATAVSGINARFATGTDTFVPTTGKTIAHGMGVAPDFVMVMPTTTPNGYLGEVWVTSISTTTFIVNHSGSANTTFMWFAFKKP